jgi:hypothetical protein
MQVSSRNFVTVAPPIPRHYAVGGLHSVTWSGKETDLFASNAYVPLLLNTARHSSPTGFVTCNSSGTSACEPKAMVCPDAFSLDDSDSGDEGDHQQPRVPSPVREDAFDLDADEDDVGVLEETSLHKPRVCVQPCMESATHACE